MPQCYHVPENNNIGFKTDPAERSLKKPMNCLLPIGAGCPTDSRLNKPSEENINAGVMK